MADYPVDIPETVTVSESLAAVAGFVAAPGETVTGPSESDGVVAGFVAGLGETVTLSESEGELGAYVEPIGETVAIATGPSGYSPLTTSIQFDDGAWGGEVINFGDISEVKPEWNDPYTWNIWWKHTQTASHKTALAKAGGGLWVIRTDIGGRPILDLLPSGGSQFYVVATASAPAANDGEWHMITATMDGSGDSAGLQLYIDGVQLTGAEVTKLGVTTTGTLSGVAPLGVGNWIGQGWEWIGNLCHAAGWNSELTPTEVAELYGEGIPQDLSSLPTAPAPDWWCAVGDGDALGTDGFLDISVNNNHGTAAVLDSGDFVLDVPTGVVTDEGLATLAAYVEPVAESVTVSEAQATLGAYVEPLVETVDFGSPAPGYSPLTTSIDFNNDALTEYVDFGAEPYVHPGAGWTIGAWIKYTGSNHGNRIIQRGRSENNALGMMLGIQGNGLIIHMAWQASHDYFSWTSVDLPVINDGEWHFVAATQLEDLVYGWSWNPLFYIDAVNHAKDGSGGGGSTPYVIEINNGQKTLVGAHYSWIDGGTMQDFFVGQICHSFIYGRELSPAEMAQLYGGGVPQNLLGAGMPSGLLHWSALGDGDAIGAGNIIEHGPRGIDGTFINGESGDFLSDAPSAFVDEALWVSQGTTEAIGETVTGPTEDIIASIGGGVMTLPLYGSLPSAGASRGRNGSVINIGYRAAGLTTMYYRMRAWNLNTANWELWTSEDAPSAEPPSGDPITNLSIVGQWEA